MFNSLKQMVCVILVSVILLQTFSMTIVLTNYQVNKEYISKVLCVNKSKPKMHCNGKCHLKKELSKAEKKEQSPANPLKEKTEIQLFSQFNSNFELFNSFILVSNNLISDYTIHLSDKHLDSIFRPPQV